MTRTIVLPLMTLFACGGSQVRQDSQPITCSGGDIPIYSNRFAPQAGASGVATGPDAVAGKTNSDPSSTTTTTEGPATPATTTTDPATPPAPTDDGAPLVAMTVTCGQAACAPGQVGIDEPPMVPATGGPSSAPSSGAEGDSAGAPAPPPSSVPAAVTCANPPPTCPPGQSPQYTTKNTWECTDCSLVVTYGGTYGNYRRCVNAPHLNCPNGQVPTWVFEDEQWECKPTCDNGQYDQHTIKGTLVCVPC